MQLTIQLANPNQVQARIEVYGASTLILKFPKSIYGTTDKRFSQASIVFASSCISIIEQGHVLGKHGVVFSEQKDMFFDSIFLLDEMTLYLDLCNFSNLPIERKEGVIGVVGSLWPHNYFHWFFDILPKLYLFHEANLLDDISYFMGSEPKHSFQLETLAILGIDPSRFIGEEHVLYQAPQILWTSTIRNDLYIPQWVCNFFRNAFMIEALLPNKNNVEHIYIHRRGRRKLTNEYEIMHYLESIGFTICILEQLSMPEQIELFAGAKRIVAPHGAGLSNLVFCQPGAQVIELFHPCYVKACYWGLANQLGLDYWYVLGEGEVLMENSDDYCYADMTIDLHVVIQTLAASKGTVLW